VRRLLRNNPVLGAALGGHLLLSLVLASCGGAGGGPAPGPSNPRPSLSSISPTSAPAGSGDFTLTVNGSDFISSSSVRWAGANRTTTFVSATQLTAAIAAADVATGGTFDVTVSNPSPGGGVSNAIAFTVENPVPTLTSISPTSATAGGAGFTLTVTGTNFVTGSIVRWNGSDRSTTFVSATQVTAAISAADIATGGTGQVTVFNPAPAGGTTSQATFTVNNPVPGASSLSPSSAVAGGGDFTLTVNGSNFVSTSVVRWNGANRTTTSVSSTQLTAAILAGDIASAGSAQVTVFNPAPGGGTSGGLTFTITAAPPVVIQTSRLPDTGGGKFYDFTPAASGGAAPYTWSLAAGSLPGGLALDAATGRISGTASPVGSDTTSNFTLRVTDSASQQQTQDLSITVRVALGRNDACTSGDPAGTTHISNGRLRASFSPYGDVDVYSFQGTAGAEVSIELFAQRLDLDGDPGTRDSFADTMLELLDSSCPAPAPDGSSALAFNDDFSPPPDHIQDSAILNFTLPASGLYFIRVRDFRGDGRPDLLYDLSLSGAD